MSNVLPVVVVSDSDDLPAHPGLRIMLDHEFLGGSPVLAPGTPVVNLCADRGYLSNAWYVSLLAEARGGQPLPEPALLEQDRDRRARDRALREQGLDVLDVAEVGARLRQMALAGTPRGEGPPVVDDPDEPVPRTPRPEERLTFRVLAGRPWPEEGTGLAPKLSRLARKVFAAWPLPLCEVELVRDAGRWRIVDLRPLVLEDIDDKERSVLVDALAHLTVKAPAPSEGMPSLAVLWDGADVSCASTAETMDKLAKVAQKRGLRVERIGTDDLDRLGEHDALFIRILTGVDQPAWRFANRAEALGMPVIDHPTAIVRCGNKVYLHELLTRAKLAVPKSVIFGREASWEQLVEQLGTPVIVKVPDGSFSTAVFKVTDADDFQVRVPPLLERSPLLVAQQYLPTAFDWRIGVLDGKVLYSARYHMVPGHWQIRALKGSSVRFGRVEAVPRDKAPTAVKRLAVAASELIGDGFFGVDIKETDSGPVVIEVNDNPNLDVGYEDGADGEIVYEELVRWFQRRLRTDLPKPTAPRPRPARREQAMAALRQPIGRKPPEQTRPYKAYEVTGLELEYPVVDRDLNVIPLVEEALAALAGRPCSDVELGRVGFSNEIVDHVLEVKNVVPHRSLVSAEEDLVEGVRRLGLMLDNRWRARLLPGGMHPWFRPEKSRIWRRSNRKIYETYARLFDVHSHGWSNVQAVHVNLPFGTPEEATAMLNAARLLVPYLPGLAASSPLVEGELTGAVDNRVAWLLGHQARLPESMARLVPEPLEKFTDYRRDVLGPMYAALDRLPDAQALRHEFLNARGAVFKASRESMEVRILDVQECVAMDIALAWFTRRALRDLSRSLDEVGPAAQQTLEEDLLAVARDGSRARVWAPHLPLQAHRDGQGRVEARRVLAWHLERVDHRVPAEEQRYLDLVATTVEHGSLGERLRQRLAPLAEQDEAFTEAARRTWIELADCLLENKPWAGRTG